MVARRSARDQRSFAREHDFGRDSGPLEPEGKTLRTPASLRSRPLSSITAP
ncbi:Hypothetical protein A7982_02963 [Minicystis rosea]|nr:Hypothetical protein A7982_02963 [Minicystis rosea]